MALIDALSAYRIEVTKVNGYVDLAYEQDAAGNSIRSNEDVEFIVTSAFLKLFIAWEGFLENSVVAYLTGEASLGGNMITKYANPIDVEHAHKILIGTQKYVDWANIDNVNKIASIYFEEGEPFKTALNSISTDLSDLRVIRNASAHISSTTQNKLDAVASRVLRRSVTGINVSDFITKMSKEDTSNTVLQLYQLKLDITAENIAHNRT
ncbi:hypothetical protein [Glaciecola sp. 33A]|uniref:hypothetical protein n=1 Tax=Glaciecola sp. 33A TaxID=2057807 RepID=UPI000C3322C1|nr:hypothetical protein [Glaciecola sp. 33A]PKI00275.1 hypothetical protein CXF81_19200 [Glaciecola sp. 33A]